MGTPNAAHQSLTTQYSKWICSVWKTQNCAAGNVDFVSHRKMLFHAPGTTNVSAKGKGKQIVKITCKILIIIRFSLLASERH